MTKEQLELYLSEARTALHALMTGQSMVSVTYEGRSVTYSRANLAALRSYIQDLESKLNGRGPPFGVRA